MLKIFMIQIFSSWQHQSNNKVLSLRLTHNCFWKLLLEIRGKTIGYCAWKKKCANAAQSLALHRLEQVEIASDKQPSCLDLKRELDLARDEVDRFNEKEAEAAECRARIRWRIHGEKPSKFFSNLEKYNALQKYIPELKVKDNDGVEFVINEQQKNR